MKTLTVADIYSTPHAPYYIYAPDYTETSSGIRALHFLCHALNQSGLEAYIVAGKINTEIWAPALSNEVLRQHYLNKRKPIVIYPEVVFGKPLGLGSTVRYLLNKPGLIGGPKSFDSDELLVAFREEFAEGTGAEHILHFPASNAFLFNPDGTDQAAREGRYFYYNRLLSRGGALRPMTEGMTEISPKFPRTLPELAEIFRKAEVLYSYETGSIVSEARMCGCPVVLVPNPTLLPNRPDPNLYNSKGLAWGDSNEELEHARQTVHLFYADYQVVYDKFNRNLANFVDVTQQRAEEMPFEACFPLAIIQFYKWPIVGDPAAYMRQQLSAEVSLVSQPALPAPNPAYHAWFQAQTLQEVDAQLLAERMVLKWTHRPAFHLLTHVLPGQESLLANTLDSLAAQLYPDWMLTVITTLDKPHEIADLPSIQWLTLKSDADAAYVMKEMTVHTSFPWLARVSPGVVFQTQTLQVVADHINAYPEWALVYTDEDTLLPDDSHTQPRFWTAPDQHAHTVHPELGSCVWVRKDALELSAYSYDVHTVSRLLLKQNARQTIGHINAVLVHMPATAPMAKQPDEDRPSEAPNSQPATVTALIHSFDTPNDALATARSLLGTPTGSYVLDVLITDRSGSELNRQLLEHSIRAWGDCPVRLVDTSRIVDHANSLKSLLMSARGQHILWLTAGVTFDQPDDLLQLSACISLAEVGAVQPLLIDSQHKLPWSPGASPALLFAAGQLPADLSAMTSDVPAAIAALDARAFLIQKAVFSQYMGQAQAASTRLWALELSQFVAAQGLALRSCSAVKATVRLRADATTPYPAPDSDAEMRYAAHNLNWLASGHHYNRQLTFAKPGQFSINRITDWDVDFPDRPRLLALVPEGHTFPGLSQAQLQQLSRNGLAQCSTWTLEHTANPWVTLLELVRAQPSSVVFGPCANGPQREVLSLLATYLPTVKRVMCVDDISTVWPNPYPSLDVLELIGHMAPDVALAQTLVTHSSALANVLAPFHSDIKTVQPWLDWDSSQVPPGPTDTPHPGKPRIGLLHPAQFPSSWPVLDEVLRALKDEALFICFGEAPAALKAHRFVSVPSAHPHHITAHQLVQTQLDIALVLRADNGLEALMADHLTQMATLAACVCLPDTNQNTEQTIHINKAAEQEIFIETVRSLVRNPDLRGQLTLHHQARAQQLLPEQVGRASATAAFLP